jgi:3-methylcrotonyl-CoA carboxylase alpha subunit
MQGYLIIGEEAHALTIRPAPGGGYRLADGKSMTLQESGGPTRVQVGEAVYAADIVVAGETVWVHLGGVAHEIVWRSTVEHHARAARGNEDGAVRAPMPGAMVNVLVQAGEAVRPGDPLVVIESMKLETTLRAPRAGVAGEARFGIGESFERGAVLIEIGEGV